MDPKPCSATEWEVQQVRALIARQAGRVYLEIGSHAGGSLWAYGSAMPPESQLIAVDAGTHDPPRTELEEVVDRLCRHRYAAHALFGNSQHAPTAARVQGVLYGRPVDVLLVDADHRAERAAIDLNLYGPLVREGGLVVMHDCGFPDPPKAMRPGAADLVAGLHALWAERSAGHRRVMLQEWCGYGGWWV